MTAQTINKIAKQTKKICYRNSDGSWVLGNRGGFCIYHPEPTCATGVWVRIMTRWGCWQHRIL